MAITAAPETDTPVDVLAAMRESRAIADREEARILDLAATWAAMHSSESLPRDDGTPMFADRLVRVAGQGAPDVTEFSVAEVASVLHVSTEAGRDLLADAIELRHRLPRVWARVQAGDLQAWRARRIAQSTTLLGRDGAAYVDRHVAPFAHRIGIAQLDRLVQEALIRFEPERARAQALEAANGRRMNVYVDQVAYDGTVHVQGELDLADALDLDAALVEGAARLAALGCPDPLDARRARAMGELARGAHPTLPLGDGSTATSAGGVATPVRQIVLYVHLSEAALRGADDSQTPSTPHLARVDNTRSFVDADQVRSWCGQPGSRITVKPVIDLADHVSVHAYEVPDRLAEQSALVDVTCVFPWCSRPARTADCDHVQPHADGGLTCSCNMARLCRRHHRLKTHSAWRYTVLERGSYLWTSPHGFQFLRDGDGTLDVTPGFRPRRPDQRHLTLLADATPADP